MRLLTAFVLAGALVACDPAPTATVTTTAPAPSPTVAPTPTPKASPVVSAKGFISVTSPTENATLQSPVIIMGDASVFEAALQWRILDAGGKVIVEGQATASQGAPGRGTFSVTVPYSVTRESIAFVEVYSRSPKDGNIDELARVPVTLR